MTTLMTAEQATTFERLSQANMMILTAIAHSKGCNCAPYTDWFTYNRWLAQGFQVKKGEHGTKITTWIPMTKKDPETGENQDIGVKPRTTTVFCRHQVKENN